MSSPGPVSTVPPKNTELNRPRFRALKSTFASEQIRSLADKPDTYRHRAEQTLLLPQHGLVVSGKHGFKENQGHDLVGPGHLCALGDLSVTKGPPVGLLAAYPYGFWKYSPPSGSPPIRKIAIDL